jgi:hypothetical protein
LQDRKGYMWFGTDRGLVKFDGYSFHTITSEDGLTDNVIFGLYEDDKGKIWYQPYSRQLGYVYNDKPYSYQYNRTIRSILGAGHSKAVLAKGNDEVYVSYDSVDYSKGAIHIDASGSVSPLCVSKGIRDIFLAPHGSKLLTVGKFNAPVIRLRSLETSELLLEINRDKNELADLEQFKHAFGPLVGDAYVYQTKDSSMFLYDGYWILFLKNGKVSSVIKPKERVLAMETDSMGNLWIGYYHRGVELYEAEYAYSKSKHFLQEYSVSGMACDNEGNLWFTTLENGIYFLPRDFCYSYSPVCELPKSSVTAIRKTGGGSIALILSNENIAVKHPKDDAVILASRKVGYVYDIYADSITGKYFISGQERRYYLPNTIYLGHYKKIYPGINDLWGLARGEIDKFDLSGKWLKRIWLDSIGILSTMYEITPDHFLVGTLEGLYNYKDQIVSPFAACHDLYGHRVSDIKQIDPSHFIIATIGNGLIIAQEGDWQHPRQFSVKEGLPSAMCNVVLPEGDSVVWVGTNKGLSRITNILDPQKQRCYTLDVSTGLPSSEIYDICITGNDLWVATANGLARVPKTYNMQPPRVRLHIEQIQIDGRSIDMNQQREFRYNQNNLSIAFVGLNYEFSGKLKYKYRLRGVDDRWNITTNRNVIYNTLPPGKYTFEFKVLTPTNEQETEQVQSYSFIIHAPFWTSWWFILLMALAFTGAMYTIVYYRVKAVRNQARVKQDLKRFREKALRKQMNPHFLYNSLNSIQNFIHKSDAARSIDLLSKFSSLMRLTFNNSGLDLVTLEKDLEALRLYTDMESMRFPGRFTLHINIDPELDPRRVMVPPLLIQPFVENTILHGFLSKTTQGNIWLNIVREKDKIRISIKDDGIGRKEALSIRKRKEVYRVNEQREYSGMTVTAARIEQVWGNDRFRGDFQTIDLTDSNNTAIGTLIVFYIPLIT